MTSLYDYGGKEAKAKAKQSKTSKYQNNQDIFALSGSRAAKILI
jgi:hypothetical protein